MWKGRFSGETKDAVLKFTQSLDIDWILASYDIAGSIAHAEMLAHTGIISMDDKQLIIKGLEEIKTEIEKGEFVPSVYLEDVHMNIEKRLTELVGSSGTKLHSGRSRNDQIATTLRLFMKDKMLEMGYMLLELLAVLTERAKSHNGLVVPGYTHLQRAQPVNMGHYWLSHFNTFCRDGKLLLNALETCDESPLGSGALAGSSLPLDRDMTTKLLGFSSVSNNSIDGVSSRDHLLDYHYFATRFMIHCSRLAEDMIIYNSQEFGWIVLPDAFCTGSSMMPQKKNPDVFELIRGKCGQVTGNFFDLLMTLKGLPSTYNRDMQEDKRGLIASFNTLESVLEILIMVVPEIEVNEFRVFSDSSGSLCLATDVAEYLVKKGVPFRDAHWKVGTTVKWCIERKLELTDLTLNDWQANIPEVDKDLLEILSFKNSINNKETSGGTSESSVLTQLEEAENRIEVLRNKLKGYKSINC